MFATLSMFATLFSFDVEIDDATIKSCFFDLKNNYIILFWFPCLSNERIRNVEKTRPSKIINDWGRFTLE